MFSTSPFRMSRGGLGLPAGVMLVLGIVGILVQAQLRLGDMAGQQVAAGQRAAALASQDIARAVDAQRHLLRLFIQEHRPTLEAVIAAPDAPQAQAALERQVTAYFPDAFAHTLTDEGGVVLLDDFAGLVGEACQENIRLFTRTDQQHLVLHVNPVKPHYDVMTRLDRHVFFVSFEPDALSRILLEHAPRGMRLVLARRDSPHVDLSPPAPPGPSWRLSAAEMASRLASEAVPDTDWRVDVLPHPGIAAPGNREILEESALAALALLLFVLGFQWLLNRERTRRALAETRAEEMATLGFVDPLTGLANRRALDEDLAREWLNMERSNEPLSLLMIDLDHFKAFNDTYGHLAGDHCLRTVAQAMRATLRRPRDRIARFGGEEFSILLPNTPCLAAKLLAEALHESVREAFAMENESGVTVSIGVSCAHAGQLKSANELLDLADQALYGAKGAGRDTTVVIPA